MCVCVWCVTQQSQLGVLMTVLRFLWLAPLVSIHYLFFPPFSLPPPPPLLVKILYFESAESLLGLGMVVSAPSDSSS